MPTQTKGGRLVWNHNTHVEGLIPILKKLIREPGIQTVTPGRVRQVRGRGCILRIRVSVPVSGGWKVNVRHGSMAQEVFVTTHINDLALQAMLDRLMQ